MKSIKTFVLGLACAATLASCAQTITAAAASKMADGYSISKATSAGYAKCHLVTKTSDGKSSEEDLTGAGLTLLIGTLVPVNVAAVKGAALIEGVEFKADGDVLEFSYKDADGAYEYKINGDGLTLWSKVTTGSTWESNAYTWSK